MSYLERDGEVIPIISYTPTVVDIYGSENGRPLHHHIILAKDWQPWPEGTEAQPIWTGKVLSEDEQRFQTDPAFTEG